jgi:hypothetical protein
MKTMKILFESELVEDEDEYYDETEYHNEDESFKSNEPINSSSTIISLNITLTSRGNPKSYENGFYYTISRDNGEIKNVSANIEWKCQYATNTQRNAKCPGRATSKGMFQPLNITREHNHLPEPEKQVKYETTAKAKEAAKISGEKPKTIIENVYSQARTSAGADLVRPENLRHMIKRLRKSDVKTGHWESVHDIELIEELTKTIENELFLWADSGKNDPERTLVFNTIKFYEN